MSFTFIVSKEFNLGVQQLLTVLDESSIEYHVIFSEYSAFEVGYLRYMESAGTPSERSKAHELLQNDRRQLYDKVVNLDSRVIGFSVTTEMYQYWLNIARDVKSVPSLPRIVMGGIHPTLLPERVIAQDFIDAVFIGEADRAIVEIYSFLSKNFGSLKAPAGLCYKIGGVVFKSEPQCLVENLDGLPYMEMELFVKEIPSLGQTYHLSTSRGCPFDCSYCTSGALKHIYSGLGKYVRKRSPEHVLGELKLALSKWAISSVDFLDDVFTMDSVWLSEFLPRFQHEIGLPFRCLIHPLSVKKETLKLLKDSGCSGVKMGVQHVNPALCEKIFNRKLDLEKIRNVIRWSKEIGIVLKLDFIIGVPTETEEDLIEMAEFIKKSHADDIFLYFLTYYPCTKILKFAIEHGDLTNQEADDIMEGRETSMQFMPDRFKGPRRELYERFNHIIREAGGSRVITDLFEHLKVK